MSELSDFAFELGRQGSARVMAEHKAAELRDILNDLLWDVGQVCDDIGDYKLYEPQDVAHVLHDAIAKARGRL